MEKITSLQNLKIKNILKLDKARERTAQGLFVIEGAREMSLAVAAGYTFDSVFICPELFEKTDYPDVLDNINNVPFYEVSRTVFDKIAYRSNSDGLLVLAHPRRHRLEDLELSEPPFIIVLEAVEKPGNLGAILRTADAARASAVIVCDPTTDVYNPNVIRSSVGCLFTVQVAICNSEDALHFLNANNINVYAAALQASECYTKIDMCKSSAVVFGTEADGLTPFWIENTKERIRIPMRGAIDSLNVSVSVGVITFEAMSQRNFM